MKIKSKFFQVEKLYPNQKQEQFWNSALKCWLCTKSTHKIYRNRHEYGAARAERQNRTAQSRIRSAQTKAAHLREIVNARQRELARLQAWEARITAAEAGERAWAALPSSQALINTVLDPVTEKVMLPCACSFGK